MIFNKIAVIILLFVACYFVLSGDYLLGGGLIMSILMYSFENFLSPEQKESLKKKLFDLVPWVIVLVVTFVFWKVFTGQKVINTMGEGGNLIQGWSFIGYDYRWSEKYVEDGGFNSQLECVKYGNVWIDRQESDEAIFTCSSGCKKDSNMPSFNICNKVCEYTRTGLVKCRN